jgi:ribosomal 30S subunit maturation factor RimM
MFNDFCSKLFHPSCSYIQFNELSLHEIKREREMNNEIIEKIRSLQDIYAFIRMSGLTIYKCNNNKTISVSNIHQKSL